jgi:DNA-binding NarL/FixJ family response regulator
MAVCAEADDARSAVDAAADCVPEIAVLAVDMHGGGLTAAAEIHHRLPGVRIVMLANELDDDDMLQALRAGACGYLPKETSLDRLPFALHGVLAGEAALPRTLVGRLVEEYCDRAHRRLAIPGLPDVRLTTREWEVLEALREGLDTSEMGERLGICPVTVRRHVASLLHKLGVPDRAAAVALLDRTDGLAAA